MLCRWSLSPMKLVGLNTLMCLDCAENSFGRVLAMVRAEAYHTTQCI
jgi:hypothetical protein